MPELTLSAEQAKLASLALAYHLGRPGSEIDPDTLQPSRRGLRMAAGILEAQRDLPQAKLTLDDYQVHRLGEAMLQTISELKVLAMMQAPWAPGEATGHSVNVDFERAAASLYPVLRNEPGAAQEIAGALMLLYRRLTNATAVATEERTATPPAPSLTGTRSRPPHRPWWRLWGRSSRGEKN